MENATNTSCDDSSRANYANRLLSRAITERRRPDTVSSRIFGIFAKSNSDSQSLEQDAKREDDSKVLTGAGQR
ncbi:MAG: hypothetical protein C0507_01380 [Cyanobacteria bacterium PR.3.49]|jgi:hypothetical protein|nr:hypothetical protein [Cyanobacteria bacterium PR.3.49]